MALLGLPLAVWYFGWLLNPDRIGTPYLYGLLIAAELFNLDPGLRLLVDVRQRAGAQAEGTEPAGGRRRVRPGLQGAGGHRRPDGGRGRRACAAPRCASGCSTTATTTPCATWPRATAWATSAATSTPARRPATSTTRSRSPTRRSSPSSTPTTWPTPASSRPRSGYMEDPAVAFVQTPQYYANHDQNRVAAASWSQQALFFGAIARGKDGLDAVFCCGTNVLFRREAFESVGGFPDQLAHRGLRALDLAPREGLEVGLRAGRAVARPRPRGHGRLRVPAAALGAGVPVRAPARAAGEAAAEAQGAVPAVGLVLPVGVDGADLHELPGDPAAHRRPADRRHRRRPSSCSTSRPTSPWR